MAESLRGLSNCQVTLRCNARRAVWALQRLQAFCDGEDSFTPFPDGAAGRAAWRGY